MKTKPMLLLAILVAAPAAEAGSLKLGHPHQARSQPPGAVGRPAPFTAREDRRPVVQLTDANPEGAADRIKEKLGEDYAALLKAAL